MEIDKASRQLFSLALYLNKLSPGAVSENWIDKEIIKEILGQLPKTIDLEEETFEINSQISLLTDSRRKIYLNELLQSITHQLRSVDKEESEVPLEEFLSSCFGIHIERVSEIELSRLDKEISELESKARSTRQDTFKKRRVNSRSVQKQITEQIGKIKEKLTDRFYYPTEEGLEIKTVSRRPWTAFTEHVAPFRSKLSVNTDTEFTDLGITRLAIHEGYGGHHTELTLKDRMLIEEGRAEHGFVLTYSPQTFMSEAIAEAAPYIFGLLPDTYDLKLVMAYYHLELALQNAVAFMHFADNAGKTEIETLLSKFGLSDESKKNIHKFATNTQWGRYSAIYYPAFHFLMRIYKNVTDEKAFINEIYTDPVTPNLLLSSHSA